MGSCEVIGAKNGVPVYSAAGRAYCPGGQSFEGETTLVPAATAAKLCRVSRSYLNAITNVLGMRTAAVTKGMGGDRYHYSATRLLSLMLLPQLQQRGGPGKSVSAKLRIEAMVD